VRAHDIILDYRWTTLVGGHVGRLGVRADGDVQRQYIRDLDASVRQTMTSLDPTPFFQKYGPSGNAWAIFKTYLDAAAQQAAAPIVDKYLGKLAEQTCSLSITPSRCSSHRALTPAYWAHSGSGHRSTGDAHRRGGQSFGPSRITAQVSTGPWIGG